MPMDQSYPLRCAEECPLGATVWRSPSDPADKQTADKGQVVAQAQAQALNLCQVPVHINGLRQDEVRA